MICLHCVRLKKKNGRQEKKTIIMAAPTVNLISKAISEHYSPNEKICDTLLRLSNLKYVGGGGGRKLFVSTSALFLAGSERKIF